MVLIHVFPLHPSCNKKVLGVFGQKFPWINCACDIFMSRYKVHLNMTITDSNHFSYSIISTPTYSLRSQNNQTVVDEARIEIYDTCSWTRGLSALVKWFYLCQRSQSGQANILLPLNIEHV